MDVLSFSFGGGLLTLRLENEQMSLHYQGPVSKDIAIRMLKESEVEMPTMNGEHPADWLAAQVFRGD